MLPILLAFIILGLPELTVANLDYYGDYEGSSFEDMKASFSLLLDRVSTTTTTTTTTTPSPIPSMIEDFRDEMTSMKTDLDKLKTASIPSILMNKLLILTNVKLVASCEDLAQVGAVNPGYFRIAKNGVQSTVYCNFGKNELCHLI